MPLGIQSKMARRFIGGDKRLYAAMQQSGLGCIAIHCCAARGIHTLELGQSLSPHRSPQHGHHVS